MSLSGGGKINSAFHSIFEDVHNGMTLSSAFESRNIFPGFLVQMVAVGEESGSLEKMLLSAAEMFEDRSTQAIKKLTLYIEPVATLTVGLAVGFVAVAIMMPLFSMMNTLL